MGGEGKKGDGIGGRPFKEFAVLDSTSLHGLANGVFTLQLTIS